jgi:N-acyl-phosphatidylethanolamine-hydrolysing phospholipase D
VHTNDLDITCTPAQHFSGRRLTNRDTTLWCGWTIRAGDRAVFFAGDTGRHPEFSTITQRLGPFDAALLPIGAYDPRWFMQPVHMAPEEAVSAYGDIAAANAGRPCRFVATHWGTFKLTDEPLDEPPALTRVAWSESGFDPELLCIPAHGETVVVPA